MEGTDLVDGDMKIVNRPDEPLSEAVLEGKRRASRDVHDWRNAQLIKQAQRSHGKRKIKSFILQNKLALTLEQTKVRMLSKDSIILLIVILKAIFYISCL